MVVRKAVRVLTGTEGWSQRAGKVSDGEREYGLWNGKIHSP